MYKKVIRELQFRSPMRRYFFPHYEYMFSPAQLCFLCACLEETRNVAGDIVEVGCSSGATTVFLSKYLKERGIDKRYTALDTFCGFMAEDIKVEIQSRGKHATSYRGFRTNDKRWFDATMREHAVRVDSIEGDVNATDLRKFAPLAFVLLDVDLYRPMIKALPELYDSLAPGGIIIVDDCDSRDVHFDGAHQAYQEFMERTGLPPTIIHTKLGVVRKPASLPRDATLSPA